MNEKIVTTVLIVIFLASGGWLVYDKFYRGAKPAITPPPADISDVIDNNNQQEDSDENETPDRDGVNETEYPLDVPDNFKIELLTDKVPEARDVEMGPRGNLWVTRTDAGVLTLISIENGEVQSVTDIMTDLNNPHGIAFHPQNEYTLFMAEEDKISKLTVYSEGSSMEKVADLPEGGRHYTRDLGFGPDNKLYVSIGSTCDVCFENNSKHGTIQVVSKETGELEPYASGLRNAVFFTWNYVDGSMWATEMGRDHLGDNLPPDEINVVKEDTDYGWPVCYGNNVYDTKFDGAPNTQNPCEDKEPSKVNLQAHVAPLGIQFVPEEGWPEKYWYDAMVAYHGSWNRSVPVGYKIKNIKIDDRGNIEGKQDFISGWLIEDNSSLGRPVDILIQPGGVMYITDDKAGAIYKVSYLGDSTSNTTSQNEKIKVSNLKPKQKVEKNFTVKGEAKGNWFFEASFPIRVLDEEGERIDTFVAHAQSDWMTEGFVPFEANVDLTGYQGNVLTLKLEKANPSGLSKNDESIEIPLNFGASNSSEEKVAKDGCVISGCSSEICSEKEQVSTCEYVPEYSCLEGATCEKQSNGECGWTMTEEIRSCFEKYQSK